MSESLPYLRGLKREKYYTFLVKREYFSLRIIFHWIYKYVILTYHTIAIDQAHGFVIPKVFYGAI